MAKPLSKGAGMTRKLLGLVLFLTCVSAAVGLVASWGVSRNTAYWDDVTQILMPQMVLVEEVQAHLAKARQYEKDFLLYASLRGVESKARREQSLAKLEDVFDELGEKLNDLKTQPPLKTTAEGGLRSRALQLDARLGTVLDALEPLSEKLLSGVPFQEVASEYALYQEQVETLEGGVTDLRRGLDGELKTLRGSAESARIRQLQLLGAAVAVVLVVGLLAGLKTARRLSGSLRGLQEGMASAAAGQFKEIEVSRYHEFADIARTFNETMSQFKRYIQTDQERQLAEQNLIGFLEVVSEAADGDLTVKAPVTADAFGSIADAYNLMVESLAELMSETRQRAVEVGSETRRLLEIFVDMETGAEAQAGQVQEATESVDQTAAATREIALKATTAHQVSAQVDEATGQGNELVNRNIEGMQLIRVTVQTINKKMKSLSERLLEIGSISELISEIATRTTILAMNASIEASRAGEQGRGFLVISDEIKKLADKSAEATKQIKGVVKAIQTEAGEVTAALEEETRTVEEQTQLAKDTGEAFARIEEAIGGSKAVVGEIFSLSDNQKALTNDAVRYMEAVSSLSLSTRGMVKDSARITEGLNALSENLLGALAQFKLPGDLESMEDADLEMQEDADELSMFDTEGEEFDLTAS